jgi:hypothetical protein
LPSRLRRIPRVSGDGRPPIPFLAARFARAGEPEVGALVRRPDPHGSERRCRFGRGARSSSSLRQRRCSSFLHPELLPSARARGGHLVARSSAKAACAPQRRWCCAAARPWRCAVPWPERRTGLASNGARDGRFLAPGPDLRDHALHAGQPDDAGAAAASCRPRRRARPPIPICSTPFVASPRAHATSAPTSSSPTHPDPRRPHRVEACGNDADQQPKEPRELERTSALRSATRAYRSARS